MNQDFESKNDNPKFGKKNQNNSVCKTLYGSIVYFKLWVFAEVFSGNGNSHLINQEQAYICKIWGFHSDYEEGCLLGCGAV
jgi:hypothetical protein